MIPNNVEVGQIWEVLEDMPVDPKDENYGGRKILINKGEKIEIRYPYAWHFRTIDNVYLHVDESILLKKCKLYGIIWDKVRSTNRADLREIINLKLFDEI